MILRFLVSPYMRMTTSFGFAEFPGADFDERTGSQLTAPAHWILGASILGSAAALLRTLLRTSIAVPRIKALLPSAILPIFSEHQAKMIGVFLQECSAQTFQGIVDGLDHVD